MSEAPEAATVAVSDGDATLSVTAQDTPPPAPPPTPGDIAKEPKAPRTPEEYETEIQKLRKESAGYRTKLREAEPLVKAAQEAEEANKTEVQRAQDAIAAEKKEKEQILLELLAVRYNVPEDLQDLIGSGSREQMEANAARLGAHTAPPTSTPPPSNRPVEGLRPGASPEPPAPEDDSYPASWRPPHLQQTS
jgi:hypothetical protein